MKSSRFRLPQNPAADADRRRLPQAGVLLFYTPEEIEAVAHALEAGAAPSRDLGPHRARVRR
jgi:hypothetical protein